MMVRSRLLLLATILAGMVGACRKSEPTEAAPAPGAEQKVEKTEAPASDEIKVGQTMPYSGPASAYGAIGKFHQAYFAWVNKNGGVNGKKINLISLDDSYSPPRAVEQTRKLVEQDKVQLVFNSVGTASNSAVHKYLNEKQIPQLFVSSGASKWNDPQNHPWTIGFNPSYKREGRTYAEHILKTNAKAKVAVLYQNDDLGKDLLEGLKEGFGASKNIVAEASYETSDPTVDSQIVTLKGSKADTLVIFTTPKFGAQAIRKVADLKWKPTARYITNVSASIGTVLIPAGTEKAKGMYTMGYTKDPAEKQYENDEDVKEFLAFMKNEYPAGDIKDGSNAYAFMTAKTLIHVLKQCGDDLSGKNIMKQAASLKDFNPGILFSGVTINTSDTDFELFDKLRLVQFNGERWAGLEGETAQNQQAPAGAAASAAR